MTFLLVAFLAAAALLWLSVFGYLLVLRSLAFRTRLAAPPLGDYPHIAVLVPTLNEEPLVSRKLANLRGADYPRDRMDIIVVDGGSTDGTAAAVQAEIDRGEPVHLVRLDDAIGKTDQINRALGRLNHEIVVVTDADSVLEPSCIPELVRLLSYDPSTLIVGATIRPDSVLLEERIHWWFLNHLWWLEGEAFGAAVVSGVCYAIRRSAVPVLPRDAFAEDAHLAIAAGALGRRARICLDARATETRVPQSAAELVHFRRRRGSWYVRELRRPPDPAVSSRTPIGCRFARRLRLWHFLVTPRFGLALAASGAWLLSTEHWRWPLLILAGFLASTAAVLSRARDVSADGRRWWHLGLAAGRLVGLTWLALLTLPLVNPQIAPGDAR